MNAKQRRKKFRAEWRRVRDGGMVFADPKRAPAWTKKTADELMAELAALTLKPFEPATYSFRPALAVMPRPFVVLSPV